jgi:tetratricopeptide (TPR) repeat protein
VSSSPHPTGTALRSAREQAARGDWHGILREHAQAAERGLPEEPELAYLVADALHRRGEVEEAIALATRVEPVARRGGDRRLALRTVNLIGMCEFLRGRIEEAEERFGDLMELARSWEDEEFAARASNNLGVLSNVRSRQELALSHYQHALAAYHRMGHPRGLAQTHHNLGISYRDLGFPEEADAHFRRAIEFATQAGDADVIGMAELERALLRVHEGDAILAESLAARVLARFEQAGDEPKRAEALRVVAAAARARAQDARAAELLDRALDIASRFAQPLLRAEVQRDRGLLLRERGDPAGARAALVDAAARFASIGADHDARAVRALIDSL